MAVYKVPQDVEADDKLLGPFSFKQFVFLVITVMSLGIAWVLSRLLLPLGIIPLPIALFFGALALPLRKDQPMEVYLAAVVSFIIKPKRRLWRADGVESLVTVVAPQTEERQYGKGYDQAEVQRRLSYLATLVDSRGWSVRGVAGPEEVDSSMQADLYHEAQAIDDVLDENNARSRQIGSLIDQANAERRQEMLQRMRQPLPPTPVDQTGPLSTDAPIIDEPSLTLNPYPTMHQSVLQPLGQQPAPTPVAPAPAPPAATTPITPAPAPAATTPASTTAGTQTVSPGIIDLANNHSDLSVETIQREAQRLRQKETTDEVVISLR